jgi:hypothetical protein
VRSALTSDLPLKALALVLAVLAWLVVREKLETDETVANVPVEIVVPDSVVLLAPENPTVNLRLRGTWGEVARARQAMASARGIRLRLRQLQQMAKGEPSGRDNVRSTSVFDFPFDFPHIVTLESVLTVEWSLVQERTLPVEGPAIVFLGHSDVVADEAVPDETTVRLVGPATLLGSPSLRAVRLDDVDATRWLKTNPDLATPYPWESRFDQWRRQDPYLRSERVLKIVPGTIKGKVRFRAVGGRVLSHVLWQEIENPSWRDAFEYEIKSPEYDPATRVLRLGVRGAPDVLDRMERDPSSWRFVVALPPPPEGDAEQRDVEVPVQLRAPDGANVSLDNTRNSTVFVSVRRRASGG